MEEEIDSLFDDEELDGLIESSSEYDGLIDDVEQLLEEIEGADMDKMELAMSIIWERDTNGFLQPLLKAPHTRAKNMVDVAARIAEHRNDPAMKAWVRFLQMALAFNLTLDQSLASLLKGGFSYYLDP